MYIVESHRVMWSHHSRDTTDNDNGERREQASFFGDFLLPIAAIMRIRTIDSYFFIPSKSRYPNDRSVSFRETDTNCSGDPFTRNSPLLLLLLREKEKEN